MLEEIIHNVALICITDVGSCLACFSGRFYYYYYYCFISFVVVVCSSLFFCFETITNKTASQPEPTNTLFTCVFFLRKKFFLLAHSNKRNKSVHEYSLLETHRILTGICRAPFRENR